MSASATNGQIDAPLPLEHASLVSEVQESIEVHGPGDLAALREELDRLSWRRTPAGEAIAHLLDRASTESLLASATAMSRDWLNAT
ncbi:MAG: hypothetical protein R3B90_22440 [Planctomycetaceae bacterium]